MSHPDSICVKGLTQNNLKNVSLCIPKEKIVVFTGVSGSGKSSIVFDTIDIVNITLHILLEKIE